MIMEDLQLYNQSLIFIFPPYVYQSIFHHFLEFERKYNVVSLIQTL